MEPPSSPPGAGATSEETLAWYKSQYAQLELELVEFKDSSLELERELEKDIVDAEKRERTLQERAERLGFEVEEWKRKYKESKTEANSAQNTLEKEITTLRDANRTLQLKLRDIEVANDDFERQARNNSSSLEDMESKYNQAVERGVLLEEEVKIGEQEREDLRIEAQRMKEELADLKIEAELLQDKVRKYERRQHLSTASTDVSVLESPTFDRSNHTVTSSSSSSSSPNSAASSPLITTPTDAKSLTGESLPDLLHDPPSPPMSDVSAPLPKVSRFKPGPPGATARRSRLPSMDAHATPKARSIPTTPSKPTASSNAAAAAAAARTPARGELGGPSTVGTATARNTAQRAGGGGASTRGSNSRGSGPSQKAPPASASLAHIKNLTEKMQRLEDRVHKVRAWSKLPTSVAATPPAMSPSGGGGGGGAGAAPSTVAARPRKRSSVSGCAEELTPTPATSTTRHIPRLSTSGISRLSFGPLPNRGPTSVHDSDSVSRPSSRASMASSAAASSSAAAATAAARPESRTAMGPPRPVSRSSFSSIRTPVTRPRSSLGGSVHSQSASASSRYEFDEADEEEDEFQTPSRRGTYSKLDADRDRGVVATGSSSTIPLPRRRMSGGLGRRTSSAGVRDPGGGGSTIGRPASSMGLRPPSVAGGRPLEDLGETY